MKIIHFVAISILFLTTTAFGYQSTATFLALSDIHFNPYDICHAKNSRTKAPCPLIQKLQAAPAEQWAAIFEKYDSLTPSTYGSDSNAALVTSTLNKIKTLPKTYQFVILSGDLLGHHYQRYFQQFATNISFQDYQKFIDKTNRYLQLQLEKAFPGIPIYLVPGNNDTYENDYQINFASGFYNRMAQLWQRTIYDPQNKIAFNKTYSQAGYYAITVKSKTTADNRLIFLNSVLFSIFAVGSDVQTKAQQELAWLQQQLQEAKQQHQHVWLVYHIPNGIDAYATTRLKRHMHINAPVPFWHSQYNTAFLSLIKSYADTITALITAHEHMDSFQLINVESSHPVLNTFIPAISPLYGNNPAFKLYEYKPDSAELKNFQTYYLNANTGHWALEYDFGTAYKTDSLLKTYSKITQTGWRTDRYKQYYAADTNSQPITQNYWLPYYWCAINQQTEEGYRDCIG